MKIMVSGKSVIVNPCPFCSGRATRVDCDRGLWFVRCDLCGARGPEVGSTEKAVEGWNVSVLTSHMTRSD